VVVASALALLEACADGHWRSRSAATLARTLAISQGMADFVRNSPSAEGSQRAI